MATILIDKLLQTQVNRNASDLHITVGQPPVLRIDGRLVRLETKVLEPEDTVVMSGSIWFVVSNVVTVVAQLALVANVYYWFFIADSK